LEVNAPAAKREASGSPLEGGEESFFGHLIPKFEIRSTQKILMTKIRMAKTDRPLTDTKPDNLLFSAAF